MDSEPHWITVRDWNEISSHLTDIHNQVSFFISASTLQCLGAPIVKIYQDSLPTSNFSLIVECATRGQALSCAYHGIKNILYNDPKKSVSLQSLLTKLNLN
jgi:hypothetical protein